MYQSDLSAAGIYVAHPDPAVLKTPIGKALHDLAEKVGAYTHKPHSVSQPASSPAKRATIIRNSLVRSSLSQSSLARLTIPNHCICLGRGAGDRGQPQLGLRRLCGHHGATFRDGLQG